MTGMYGYVDDNVPSGNGLQFGLNAGVVRMTGFGWINDAGKDNTEGEALDIKFECENGEKPISFRRFPVVKAFDGDNGEVTDPDHPAFKRAVRDFGSIITHIMGCFVDKEVLQQALQTKIGSFKEYCKVLESLLPENYADIKLDLFAQYQWQISGENKRTYLDIPKKMSYGRWLSVAVEPVGEWKEVRKKEFTLSTAVALKYVDDEGNVHPFKRNGWFMLSNFAKQQVAEVPDSEEEDSDAPNPDENKNWGKSDEQTESNTQKLEEAKKEASWDDLKPDESEQ